MGSEQYKDIGTVTVTNASQIVIGASTDFSGQLSLPCIFKVNRDNESTYSVGAISSATRVILAANYLGSTDSGVGYIFCRSFTPSRQYWRPLQGDKDFAEILSQETIDPIDEDIGHIMSGNASVAGTTTHHFKINTNSSAIRLNASGLTASRDYTFPDQNATLAGLSVPQTFSADQTINASLWVKGNASVDGTMSVAGITTLRAAADTAYATVASHATTSAIWAAAGNIINFTGTETITDFPAADQAGAQRFLICAAACVFTHAGNITVQGGATYTAVAGDVAIVTALSTTTFKVNILKNIIAATSGANSDITSLTALSGQQTIPTINLTGGQIAFPATAVPSADANTLDDYEEGTWTITVTCNTSGTITLDSTKDLGAYTKIGRLIHLQGAFQVSSVSSPLGTAKINIPFTIATATEWEGTSVGSCIPANVAYSGDFVVIRAESGNTFIWLAEITTNAAEHFVQSEDFAANDYVYFTVSIHI